MGVHVKRPSYALSVPVTVAGLAAVLALTGVGFVPVQAAAAAPVDCPKPLPTIEAVDGMAATGFTVEKGTVPEPFSVEVVGRIDEGIAPGVDLIMAKVSSPAITRAGGIWAGMSGSPVYAPDGRLIGAVAYGLTSNTFYAGITPAESMFPLLTTAPAAKAAASRAGASRVAVPAAAARRLVARGVSPQAAQGAFGRLDLPVSLSGAGDEFQRKLTDKFLRATPDVRVVTGGSRASTRSASTSAIRAGGNFVAALSYGATTAAAVGTTTFVCKGRAVAFGHPFLYAGQKTYSAHDASALFVQTNRPGLPPFKVANVGGVVGTVDREARAGISAELGAVPRTALVTTTLGRVGGRAVTDTSRVPTEEFTSAVAALQVWRATKAALDGKAPGSATVSMKVTGVRASGKPFTFTLADRYADVVNLASELGYRIAPAITALQTQELEVVRITSVDVKATVEPTVREYRVTSVKAKKGTRYVPLNEADVSPGGTVKVRVALASYRNRLGNRTVDLALKVPRSLPGDGASLVVEAGSRWTESEYDVPSFEALLKKMQTTGHGTTIRLGLFADDGTGQASGRKLLASTKASLPAPVRLYEPDPFGG